ncbi:hypothetical protein [Marinibactrum halimedae]|uniref:Uncharacterized protein n=1 Tax=Marinibactrum halimedae TaxID=1444977 RepID=A0AA37T423_9GAMM|nr:hypothetical protein [Marinibactrum halimedae]MCD9460924.1 hypothetical protein [Marinibactrum halimedae]GLS24598.1 hypothetical protein GCM10007877_03120 [Marinibactrum halimedae]
MTLLMILGVLAIALLVIVPLLEKFGKEYSPEEVKKISRWIIPLLALLMVLQIIRYFLF